MLSLSASLCCQVLFLLLPLPPTIYFLPNILILSQSQHLTAAIFSYQLLFSSISSDTTFFSVCTRLLIKKQKCWCTLSPSLGDTLLQGNTHSLVWQLQCHKRCLANSKVQHLQNPDLKPWESVIIGLLFCLLLLLLFMKISLLNTVTIFIGRKPRQ